MKRSLWALMFVGVVMLANPGVDVSPSHTPMLALVMGSLALAVSWLAAVRRPTPARSIGQPLRPAAAK
jgi:hypothetical protein